jgi:hypothetical protein
MSIEVVVAAEGMVTSFLKAVLAGDLFAKRIKHHHQSVNFLL